MVQRMYAKAKTFRRDITNEEHAKLIAQHAADVPAGRGVELQPLDGHSGPRHRGRYPASR